jgi:hypothetical protein
MGDAVRTQGRDEVATKNGDNPLLRHNDLRPSSAPTRNSVRGFIFIAEKQRA